MEIFSIVPYPTKSVTILKSYRSVGVLAYVLLTGCTPFGGETKQETFCNITRCQLEFPNDLFQNVSATAIQFISSLLTQDPR